ncbi:MAG: SPOR domain-containing protein [Spirochaetia bacterium]|nr:SPOR domain-containing protein [Spirochaetia bacterium]
MKKGVLTLLLVGLSVSAFSDYYICYGSFGYRENAFAEVSALKGVGIEASVGRFDVSGKTLYRVIHPKGYADRDSAKWKLKYILAGLDREYPNQNAFWVFESVGSPDFVANGPVEKETAAEETAVEETAVEETAVEETAAEETAVEETAVEETTTEETTTEETATEETATEETATEETAVEETATEETATEETATEETATEETAVEETAVEETAVEETAVEETAVEETAVEETAVEEAAVEEAAVEEAAVEETAVEETAVEETAVEETAVEETAVEETAVEETAVEDVVKPAVENPTGETVVSKQDKETILFSLKDQSVSKTLFDAPADVYAVISPELTDGREAVSFTVNLYRDKQRIASKTGDLISDLNFFSIDGAFPEAAMNDVSRTCEYTVELILQGEVLAESSFLYFND